MKTKVKNCIRRPNLVSACCIEEGSTILVTDTFCLLTGVIYQSYTNLYFIRLYQVIIPATCFGPIVGPSLG